MPADNGFGPYQVQNIAPAQPAPRKVDAGGRAAAEVQDSLVPDSYALAGPSGASLAGQPRWTTWRGSVVPLADYRQVTRSNSGQRQAAILGVARRTLQRQE